MVNPSPGDIIKEFKAWSPVAPVGDSGRGTLGVWLFEMSMYVDISYRYAYKSMGYSSISTISTSIESMEVYRNVFFDT